MAQQQRDIVEVMRDEMIMRDKIKALLEPEPRTIPEIATDLNAPESEVVFWVMGMRRYGLVEEVGRADEDGYFKYTLAKEKI